VNPTMAASTAITRGPEAQREGVLVVDGRRR
jgi:hypothetical protein